jgi:hypothetical protein
MTQTAGPGTPDLASAADAIVTTWSTMQDSRPAEPLVVGDLVAALPGLDPADALMALVAALTRAGRTGRISAPVLPDNAYQLADVLVVIPPHFRGEIATQLVGREGEAANLRLYEAAEIILDQHNEVIKGRTGLSTALAAATDAVHHAKRHLQNLHCDVEYDDTQDARDLQALLDSAARELRLAALLQGHIER